MAHDPAEELVEVIDAEGQVIGIVTRREMRQKRLPHRCVYILVCNQRGEIFLHLRTPTKDVYPDHWDVAIGGVVAAGENFADAARRELAEELGIAAQPVELFPCRYADPNTLVRGMVYHVVHDGPFSLQPEEIVRGEFVSVAEVYKRVAGKRFCPDGLQMLAHYLQLPGRSG